jgi:simple sugar transport system ATP-binding protein
MAATPSVALRNVSRRFGPVVANDDVSLELLPGRIHALVGENGAGKTTLMRILYGLIQPDAGTLVLDGTPVRLRDPAHAIRLGLGMVHQHFMLVDPLTVAENVTLGSEPRRGLGGFDRARAEAVVRDLSARHGLPIDPTATIASLSVGAQQRVEILKALHHQARVLILDEPTAVLTPQEVDELFAALRSLQAQGVTIVLITHKLGEVMALADHVTVLRQGRVVGGGEVAGFTVERLAELMVGRPIASLQSRAVTRPEVPLLEAVMLDVLDDRGLPAVRRLSVAVRGGEVVGIAGVEGNGQHELVECLAGLRPPVHGEIRIQGRHVSGRSAREHFAAGLAHIPGDRLRRGMVGSMTLTENVVLGRQRDPALGHGPWIDRAATGELARRLVQEHDVRPPVIEARAEQLSGGNQQKLVVGRELSRGARAILAAHPTRGVDLGAIEAIHRRLLAERGAGRAVLLVSSELSEILTLCDRVFVMYEGRLVYETTPAATDERTLGLHMTGRTVPAR